MEEFDYYNNLYLIYSDFLTDSQRDLFNLYYGENLSMQEIADNKKVSKSFVGKSIKDSEIKLNELENNLHLFKIKNELIKDLEKDDILEIKKNIKNIIEEL
jgi:predicted DNA-binding protein YlxM (UPF0122 family)